MRLRSSNGRYEVLRVDSFVYKFYELSAGDWRLVDTVYFYRDMHDAEDSELINYARHLMYTVDMIKFIRDTGMISVDDLSGDHNMYVRSVVQRIVKKTKPRQLREDVNAWLSEQGVEMNRDTRNVLHSLVELNLCHFLK